MFPSLARICFGDQDYVDQIFSSKGLLIVLRFSDVDCIFSIAYTQNLSKPVFAALFVFSVGKMLQISILARCWVQPSRTELPPADTHLGRRFQRDDSGKTLTFYFSSLKWWESLETIKLQLHWVTMLAWIISIKQSVQNGALCDETGGLTLPMFEVVIRNQVCVHPSALLGM